MLAELHLALDAFAPNLLLKRLNGLTHVGAANDHLYRNLASVCTSDECIAVEAQDRTVAARL